MRYPSAWVSIYIRERSRQTIHYFSSHYVDMLCPADWIPTYIHGRTRRTLGPMVFLVQAAVACSWTLQPSPGFKFLPLPAKATTEDGPPCALMIVLTSRDLGSPPSAPAASRTILPAGSHLVLIAQSFQLDTQSHLLCMGLTQRILQVDLLENQCSLSTIIILTALNCKLKGL